MSWLKKKQENVLEIHGTINVMSKKDNIIFPVGHKIELNNILLLNKPKPDVKQ